MSKHYRLERGHAKRGERAAVAFVHKRHGVCLRNSKDLDAGAAVWRLVCLIPTRDGDTYEDVTAFRQRKHADMWIEVLRRLGYSELPAFA